jgi:hypothetical protein
LHLSFVAFQLHALCILIFASDKAKDIRNQIARGFERRQDTQIQIAFDKFSEYRPLINTFLIRDCFGRFQPVRINDFQPLIPKRNLKQALLSLDVIVESDQEINDLFFVMDLDDNKGLDIDEFKKALQASVCQNFETAYKNISPPFPAILPNSGSGC